jgi:hypothetical protein
MISTVAHRNYEDILIVRARRREHLEAFLEGSQYLEGIFEDQTADYPWRVNVTKIDFADLMYSEIIRIDYDNFKNSVRDRFLASLYAKIWGVMSILGMGSSYHRGGRHLFSPDEFESIPMKTFEEDGSFKEHYRRS